MLRWCTIRHHAILRAILGLDRRPPPPRLMDPSCPLLLHPGDLGEIQSEGQQVAPDTFFLLGTTAFMNLLLRVSRALLENPRPASSLDSPQFSATRKPIHHEASAGCGRGRATWASKRLPGELHGNFRGKVGCAAAAPQASMPLFLVVARTIRQARGTSVGTQPQHRRAEAASSTRAKSVGFGHVWEALSDPPRWVPKKTKDISHV